MKKSLTFILCLSLVLVLSLSLVSAGWFSEVWNKITGKVVEDCIDTDGGLNYYVEGYVTWSGDVSQHRDSCSFDGSVYYLFETYCDANGVPQTETHICLNGCENGACIGSDSEEDKLAETNQIGKNLSRGITLYFITVLLATLALFFLTSVVLGGLL